MYYPPLYALTNAIYYCAIRDIVVILQKNSQTTVL